MPDAKPSRPYRYIPGYETWAFIEMDEGAALKELPYLSDRAAGLVAGTMMERRIETILKDALVSDDKVIDNLFEEAKPLGTFSGKIDIAYAIGLITAQGRKDLHLIRRIRNFFAHELRAETFEVDSIKSRCLELKLVDTLVGEMPTIEEPNPPRGAQLIFAGANLALKDPRARFFLCINCLIYCTLLHQSAPGSPRSPYF